MGKKSKKTAAKKKNQKKSKERAALVRKEVVEQKKSAQAPGNETKKSPKTAADDKKDKQRVKQEKAKEKQRLKEKKEKEKREANQKKRQEKIQELKDRKKKTEQVNKKGREEPAKPAPKKENKSIKDKKEKTTQPTKDKQKKQKKADSQNKPAKSSKKPNETTPVTIEIPTAETEIAAVSAKIGFPQESVPERFVLAEEIEGMFFTPRQSVEDTKAPTIVGNDPRVVPKDLDETSAVEDRTSVPEQPLEEIPPVGNDPRVVSKDLDDTSAVEDESPAPEQSHEEIAPVENDPCVVPNAPCAVPVAPFSIADLVRSALSKPEEADDTTDEIIAEDTTKKEASDITKNPIANLVHSALFKAIEPVEDTAVDNNNATTPSAGAVNEKVIKPPSTKKQKQEKPKKEPKPKKAKKNTLASLTKKLTTAVKEKSEKLPPKAKKAVFFVAASVLLLVVVGITVSIFSYNPPKKAIPVYRGLTEVSVNVRDIEAGPEQQLQKVKETQSHGNTRAFKFFANNEFRIEEWYDQFPLILGNPDTNKCDFIVTILNDDTIVYRSMGITPGKYLPSIKLFDTMPYGTYELRVIVAAYDPVTFKNIGVQHMKFKLVIGNEQGTQKEIEQTEQSIE